MTGFFRGLGDAFRGAGYIFAHSATWKWVAAPFFLSLLIVGGAIWGAKKFVNIGIAWLVGVLPESMAWLGTGLEALAWPLMILGGFFLFVALASAVSAPFNEQLSDCIEKRETGASPDGGAFLYELGRGIVHAVRRALKYLALVTVALLIGVIVPIAGPIISGGLGLVFTARFASFDAYDAYWARHRYAYQQKRGFLKQHGGRTFGLGAATAIMLAIPVLNLLALPIAAAGATLGALSVRVPGADVH